MIVIVINFIYKMSEPNYNLRSRKHLNYATLHAGKGVQFPAYGFSPEPRPLSAPIGDNTPRDYFTHDFAETKRLLNEEKERNKVLEETSQLEQMRKELEELRLRNAVLEKGAVQDPQKETTLKDLRTNPLVTSKVEQFLSQLEDSSSDESGDDDKTQKKKSTRGRRHTLRSGKASKLTSRVVNPQLWPHSHLSLSYVSKDKTYDELTLAEFAAGYAAILQRPTLPPQELRARIVHLSSLMYLATQFTWSSVRDLHAAVLFEIECGRADWGDSFTHLESRILQVPVKSSSRAGASRTEGSTAVFFCRDFQHGACKSNKDHYGTLRGERKWLQHICARCWVDARVAARHTEFSKECPLAAEKDFTSSVVTAT